jgi:hypothetical protein
MKQYKNTEGKIQDQEIWDISISGLEERIEKFNEKENINGIHKTYFERIE